MLQESVDTPMPERRRNWLSRQITRIGSIRSSSTAYSSGRPYKGNRKNSVYSSPEPVLPGQMMPPPATHKMSFSKKARQLIKQSMYLIAVCKRYTRIFIIHSCRFETQSERINCICRSA